MFCETLAALFERVGPLQVQGANVPSTLREQCVRCDADDTP